MIELTLDDLRLYARCPLEWFWERRAGQPRPQTVLDLAPQALRLATAFYYQGHADSVAAAVALVWQDWCRGWGQPDLLADLLRYAQGRAHVLGLFASGQIQRPGGGAYVAPQLTSEYRQRLHLAGLIRLGRQLDEAAGRFGLHLPDVDRPVGSVLGDVFGRCLAAAERTGPALPAREVVLGQGVAFQVALGAAFQLRGQADLAVAGREAGATLLEVHDFEDGLPPRVGALSRDLRVIAAAAAAPAPEVQAAWARVEGVVYRHWPSGQSYTVREANLGHLLAVAAAVARGLSGHVIVPRALSGYEACRACAYREGCGDWEPLTLLDAGAQAQAEHVRGAVRAAQAQLRGAGPTDPRFQAALAALGAALEAAPDLLTARAIVAEADHHWGGGGSDA